jgi:hypothetical protein
MPLINDLLNDPVTTLSNNILIVNTNGAVGLANGTVNNGTSMYQFYSKQNASGWKRNLLKSAVPVYFLYPVGVVVANGVAVDVPFAAFFCPYEPNKTLGTTVTNGARLMFTAEMDGCSFGIGSPANDGSRLVYHANRNVGGGAPQLNAQDQDLRTWFRNQHTFIHGVLSPVDYRRSSKGTFYEATTIAVADNHNQWSFYSQRHALESVVPPRYSLKGVVTVDL